MHILRKRTRSGGFVKEPADWRIFKDLIWADCGREKPGEKRLVEEMADFEEKSDPGGKGPGEETCLFSPVL